MKKYAVVTPSGKTSAWLHFDEVAEQGYLEINPDVEESERHPMFNIWLAQGKVKLSARDTDIWIRERVCPPEREGLEGILRRWGVPHYNPYLLSIALGGECVCDRDHFELVEDTGGSVRRMNLQP